MNVKKSSIMLLAILCLTACTNEYNPKEEKPEKIVPSHADSKGDNLDNLIHANNTLGFDLLTQVEGDEHHNILLSPTSVFTLLAMLQEGANGETKNEMKKVMQLDHVSDDDVRPLFARLTDKLTNHSTAEVRLAHSIWVNNTYSFADTFKQTAEKYFEAQAKEINMTSTDAADQVNEWVENATNHTIKDMVEGPLQDDFVALLINAIYFKGDWKYEFDKSLTEENTFHVDETKTVHLPFMSMEEEVNYMENDKLQAIELPYDKEEMSMQIMLPKEDVDVEEMAANFSYKQWQKWTDRMKKTEGTFTLPKFNMEYEADLKTSLQTLGMDHAFDKNQADFTSMIEEDAPLWIDEVKQTTFMEVSEEGTEAAAATSAEIKTTSANPEKFHMVVDHPFLFTITDKETDAILFIGAIAQPVTLEE